MSSLPPPPPQRRPRQPKRRTERSKRIRERAIAEVGFNPAERCQTDQEILWYVEKRRLQGYAMDEIAIELTMAKMEVLDRIDREYRRRCELPPTEWRPTPLQVAFVEHLLATGGDISKACKAVGVKRRTIDSVWRSDPNYVRWEYEEVMKWALGFRARAFDALKEKFASDTSAIRTYLERIDGLVRERGRDWRRISAEVVFEGNVQPEDFDVLRRWAQDFVAESRTGGSDDSGSVDGSEGARPARFMVPDAEDPEVRSAGGEGASPPVPVAADVADEK